MVLKETSMQVRALLEAMSCDLEKAMKGNRAAAQRVRTASILFSKLAKVFRKESLAEEKKGPKTSKASGRPKGRY